MNPISRLRTRARSDAGSSATGRLFRRYCPSVGESSRPRIESSVDLPQPEGPAIDTYSPLLMCRWMPESACVSTSSVKKTFVTPSSLISACPFSAMLAPRRPEGLHCLCGCSADLEARLLQSNAIVCVVCRHVGQNHLVADLEAGEHFDGVHRAPSQLHLDALRVHAIVENLEETDLALVLAEGGAAHEQDVVQPFELDRAVDAQIRNGAFGQRAGQRHVHRPRAVLHRRVDA